MNVVGLKKDKLLQKCELLMIKGVNSTSEISEQLGVSFNTARAYQDVIKARWADSYTVQELEVKRKELIKTTEAIITESWELKAKAKNVMEATSSLRTALQAVERLQKLFGIDNVLPQPEKPKQMQISELAHEINQLPEQEKQKYVVRVQEEIRRRGIEVNPIYSSL